MSNPLDQKFIVPVVRQYTNIRIVHIGCGGGTGGRLASDILRVLRGFKASRAIISYIGIDGDVYEEGNLSRQLCSPNDLGKNKAEVIVSRNRKLHELTDSQASFIPFYITEREQLDRLSNSLAPDSLLVVIDSVDKNTPRLLMSEWLSDLRTAGQDVACISCGNGKWNGQVTIGTAVNKEHHMSKGVEKAIADTSLFKNVESNSPFFFEVFPELIDISADLREEEMSCQERQIQNQQSFIANNTAASFALNFVVSILEGNKRLSEIAPGNYAEMIPELILIPNTVVKYNALSLFVESSIFESSAVPV